MGVSLFDSSVTNATPGVVWKDAIQVVYTVQPDNDIALEIVNSVSLPRSDVQIPASYIVGGEDAYITSLYFFFDISESNYHFHLYLGATANTLGIGQSAGPQFTDAAEASLGIAYQDSTGNTGKLDLTTFFAVDTDEPYRVRDQSGNDIAAFDAEIIGDFSANEQGSFLLVDRNHPNIDFDTLQTVDAPLAPAAPTLTATATSIEVTLTADPTSDADITSRDVRYRTGTDAWTVADDVTSPHTITGLTEGTDYEVQWRAVSSAGDGAWSPSATVTTQSPSQAATASPSIEVDLSVSATATIVDPLTLSDFDTSGLATEALALFTLGERANSGAIWGRSPRTALGTLTDGEFDIDDDNTPINEIRITSGGTDIRLLKNSTPDWSDYLDADSDPPGAGADLTLWLQTTSTNAISIEVAYQSSNSNADNLFAVGGNFVRVNIPSDFQDTLDELQEGDRLIVALTRPGAPAATASPSIEVDLSVEATATIEDPPAPQEATAAPSIEVDISVSATATIEDPPAPQEATAAPSIEVDISVSATATIEDPPAPQEATAAPSIEVDLSVEATATAVVPDTTPTAPTIDDQSAEVGTAFSFTLPAATGGNPPITTSADQLPAGLTLTDGVISGTPTTAGTTTVIITYTDDDGDEVAADFDIVVAADPTVSLWDPSAFLDSTPGVVWLGETPPELEYEWQVRLVDAGTDDRRVDNAIDPEYVVGGATIYVNFWLLRFDGAMRWRTDEQNTGTSESHGSPELTEAAEDVLGLALRLDDGTVYKWPFALLDDDDESEPYLWDAAALTAAGATVDDAMKEAVSQSATVKMILVDRTNEAIDWDTLRYRTTVEPTPTPMPTGTTPVTGMQPRPTLALPPALRYPVVVRDRHGHAVLTGLYEAQVEWLSWVTEGGPDSAAIQVSAREPGALRHTLDWLDSDILILAPGTSQVVWAGYVNRASVPAGDFTLTRSLEGYANDLRVQWTRPAGEFGGAAEFVSSAVNRQAAWQQARYGIRSVLVEADGTLLDLNQSEVDDLLAEYQNTLGTVRTADGLPSGAQLECRGHAGRLDSRYFPTRDAGQYGDIARRSENSWVRIAYHANNEAGFDELYQYADLNPNAGHGPFAPAWPQYFRHMRIQNARSNGGSNAVMHFSLYELAAGDRPGDKITASSSMRFRGGSDVPTQPNEATLEIDWVGEVGPTTELPAGGWYFGLLMGGAEVNDYRFEFNRVQDPQFWDADVIGRTPLIRQTYGGTNISWQSQGDGLSFDFFTGVTARGLAQWIASGGAGGEAGFGAHPTNNSVGYRSQVSQYFQGDSTWRSAIDQVAYADRLCYEIGADKLLRFWQADGPEAAPLDWDGSGGANFGSFLGRRMRTQGEEFLLTGASYSPMTGRVDISTPGKPSGTVAGSRLGRFG